MKQQKLLAALLALALFFGAGPGARAAEQTSLTWEAGGQEGTLMLDLEHLDGSVYGVQLELTLAGSYPGCAFVPASASAYSPACKVQVSQGMTSVTVYLTDRAPLNDGGSLALGTLNLGSGASADGVLPASAQVILLDRDLAGQPASIPVEGGGWNKPPEDPGTTDPGTNTPGTNTPGTNTPGTNTPGTDTPGTNTPGTNTPGTTTPGTTTPGTTTPDNNNSGTSKPGTSGDGGGQTGQDPQLPGVSDPTVSVPDYSGVQLPFRDVRQGDWFREAVQFVYAKGMMNGVEPDAFGPYDTTTRGMIVTILHRLEGAPEAGMPVFDDVPSGMYYAGPIAWASSNGIVNGVGGNAFQPEAPITREQMAAILYRYAQYKGLDTSGKGSLTRFSDALDVSPYAIDAIAWAVDAGLIAGMDDGRLDPAGSANRAQVATILMRLCRTFR